MAPAGVIKQGKRTYSIYITGVCESVYAQKIIIMLALNP